MNIKEYEELRRGCKPLKNLEYLLRKCETGEGNTIPSAKALAESVSDGEAFNSEDMKKKLVSYGIPVTFGTYPSPCLRHDILVHTRTMHPFQERFFLAYKLAEVMFWSYRRCSESFKIDSPKLYQYVTAQHLLIPDETLEYIDFTSISMKDLGLMAMALEVPLDFFVDRIDGYVDDSFLICLKYLDDSADLRLRVASIATPEDISFAHTRAIADHGIMHAERYFQSGGQEYAFSRENAIVFRRGDRTWREHNEKLLCRFSMYRGPYAKSLRDNIGVIIRVQQG